MTDAAREAADLLRARLGEVEAERRRLQAPLDALTDRASSHRGAVSPRRTRRVAGSRTARRAPEAADCLPLRERLGAAERHQGAPTQQTSSGGGPSAAGSAAHGRLLKSRPRGLSLSELSKQTIAQTIARPITPIEKRRKPGLPLRTSDSSTKPKVTGSNPVGRAYYVVDPACKSRIDTCKAR